MTPAQDKGYWRRWAAVVRAHNLKRIPKDQQDEERHAITLQATKNRTSAHKELTNNKEITALFRLLEAKAKPDDLNAAIPVANPEEEEERQEQLRCVYALRKKGLTDKEIQEIAAPLCRRDRVTFWHLLSSTVLKQMMHWKQFHPDQIAARRRTPVSLPLGTTADEPFVYYLRPAPTKTVVQGPF